MDDDSFQPLHIEHCAEMCPEAEDFLALPPGWRFTIKGDYVDVWFDDTLLHVGTLNEDDRRFAFPEASVA